MELESLVERFRNKDMTAFEKLYAMYHVNIHGVIHTIVKDHELAEELCQDVFVKAWDNAASYNPGKGRFFTWMLNIARNYAIDEVRSRKFRDQKMNLSADFFVHILEQPEETSEEDTDTKGLRQMLKKLKKKCTQLIEMLYFKGFTQKEASDILEIPLGTVKTRNRSCLQQLRENIR